MITSRINLTSNRIGTAAPRRFVSFIAPLVLLLVAVGSAPAQETSGGDGRALQPEGLAMPERTDTASSDAPDLGNFSISLAVEDIDSSMAFYRHLGFEQIAGVREQNWVILQNGKAVIGLFQGMFDENIITCNPTDVRSILADLKEAGVEIVKEQVPGPDGPAHVILSDPDGNTILLDQHQ